MNELSAWMILFGTPVAITLGLILSGLYFYRRGRRLQHGLFLVCGVTFLAAGIVVGIGLLIFFWGVMTNANTMARIAFLGLPVLALVGALSVSVVFVCIGIIYMRARRASYQAAGFQHLPGAYAQSIALVVLLAGSVLAWQMDLGARWHMWPYTSLHSQSGERTVLFGWHPGEEDAHAIISIEHAHVPDWLLSFELSSMDASGNISVRLDRVGGLSGAELRQRIPFEPSTYVLLPDGQLQRQD